MNLGCFGLSDKNAAPKRGLETPVRCRLRRPFLRILLSLSAILNHRQLSVICSRMELDSAATTSIFYHNLSWFFFIITNLGFDMPTDSIKQSVVTTSWTPKCYGWKHYGALLLGKQLHESAHDHKEKMTSHKSSLLVGTVAHCWVGLLSVSVVHRLKASKRCALPFPTDAIAVINSTCSCVLPVMLGPFFCGS